MRIALAPRVSSEMQFENGWSFDDQIQRGREWAERNAHLVVKTYFQPGVSAAKGDRDELLDIAEGARKNLYDGLWIRDLMRFTRSPDDIKYLREIELKYGKHLFEDGRVITTSTPEGDLDVGVRVELGKYQVAQIRKLTSHGKRARAMKGEANFSIPPTGYKREGTKIVPREDNAEGIRMVFRLFATGKLSARKIMLRVQEAGYKTNGGGLFTQDTVQAILRNKFYAGFVGYRGLKPNYTDPNRKRNSKKEIVWTKGTHPPLVSEDEWLECERIRRAKTKAGGRPEREGRVYLLGGIATCATCGQSARAHSSSRNVQKYRCCSDTRGVSCSSKHRYISERKLEPQINETMSRLVLSDEIKRRAIELGQEEQGKRDIVKERERLNAQLRRMRSLFEIGEYGDDVSEYKRKKADAEAKLAALDERGDTPIEQTLDDFNNFAAMWQGATKEERRDILRAMFDRVEIDFDAEKIAFVPKTQFAALFGAANN